MIDQIATDLYRIQIPLPGNPLRSINAYVIKAPSRNLIIDTGMNQQECMHSMLEGLRELDVNLSRTDFFITHFHMDHIGLVSKLITEKSIIYFDQADADSLEKISFGWLWYDIINYTRMHGFPESELQEVCNKNPNYRHRVKEHLSFNFLGDGDKINIGDYQFRCIKTPGHSKGHCCLYEPAKMIFLAGDDILSDITPTIQLRSEIENPLEEYLRSLDKVYELDIVLVLPGHGRIFGNCKERIEELKCHHQERIDEIALILGSGPKNAYEVASRMSWDIRYESWDQFPVLQKWFASGEAIAHLKYLETTGRIRKEI